MRFYLLILIGGGGHACASGVRSDVVMNYLSGNVLCTNAHSLYQELQNIYYGKVKIEAKEYNVVIMLSSLYKSQLGYYLLQTKYTIPNDAVNGGKEIVQVCKDISIKTGKPRPPGIVEIALIGDFDPFSGTAKFNVCLDSSLSNIEKQKVLGMIPECDVSILRNGEITSLKNMVPFVIFN